MSEREQKERYLEPCILRRETAPQEGPAAGLSLNDDNKKHWPQTQKLRNWPRHRTFPPAAKSPPCSLVLGPIEPSSKDPGPITAEGPVQAPAATAARWPDRSMRHVRDTLGTDVHYEGCGISKHRTKNIVGKFPSSVHYCKYEHVECGILNNDISHRN
ncbi:uncharacterized protein P884DRAFT_313007 [Thermothelomyces heterothallicus CBS 202.75]|uniref:uncharacterized protein n=1 Tax=Thermothelomyces heterothallicus CBS 202.75 TaxID=1149848 RepID=UPI003743A5F2